MRNDIEAELPTYESTHTTAGAFGDAPRTPRRTRLGDQVWASTVAQWLDEYSPGPWHLEEKGLWAAKYRESASYRHEHRLLEIGRGRRPLDPETRKYAARLIGFLTACKEDPRYDPLWQLLLEDGRRVRSPHYFGGIQALVAKHRSPSRAMRVMLAAERRANTILAPWGLQVSSHSLASALAHSCRPGRVAHKAVLWTLRNAFGLRGCNDIAAFRGTSRGYRQLIGLAGSEKEARYIMTAGPLGKPTRPRTRLARGLAAIRRLRYAFPWTPISDLSHYRSVAFGGNTAGLLSTRQTGAGSAAYTPLPDWYLRRKEYIIRMDADGTRTFLLQGSKTQIGICTVWATHERSEWYVEGPRGRTYHVTARNADAAVFIAKRVWRGQRRIDQRRRRDVPQLHAMERFLSQYLRDANRTILVRVSDSLKTGNCRYGTEQWRDTYFAGKYVVPLQALLPHRENHAVSRVISAVLEREMTQAE